MPLSREGELAGLWRERRLESIASAALTIETRFSAFDDYWMPFLEGQGPAGAYAAALPEDRRDRLRLGLQRRLLGDDPDRAIPLDARAWAVRGTVPLQR
jgi:hypothetical protein